MRKQIQQCVKTTCVFMWPKISESQQKRPSGKPLNFTPPRIRSAKNWDLRQKIDDKKGPNF